MMELDKQELWKALTEPTIKRCNTCKKSNDGVNNICELGTKCLGTTHNRQHYEWNGKK